MDVGLTTLSVLISKNFFTLFLIAALHKLLVPNKLVFIASWGLY